jgi:membrane protease YdiL (CAAX protease family)
MKSINGIIGLFWNGRDKRLRVFWRLLIYSIILLVLTSGLSIGSGILAILIGVFTGVDTSLIFTANDPLQLLENPWIWFFITAATCLGILAATIICGRWIDRRKFTDFGFRFSGKWWRELIFGLILGASLMSLIFLFGWLTGTIRITGHLKSYLPDGQFSMGFIQALMIYLLVGFYEELLFRGYYLVNLSEGLKLKWINKRWALILAWVISSVVFGLLHADNPNATWISTVNIIVAGIFLGLGMVLTGNLAISIGLHITWNFFQGNIFGFPVSGTRNGATLIATELTGPEWLTGGAFGPEAGVLGLIAMVLGSLLIVLWVSRKGNLQLSERLGEYTPNKQSRKTTNPDIS